MTSVNKRKQGTFYEEQASEYLNTLGYEIVERNFHAGKLGEIDLIAYDPKEDTLVFIEVKYRKTTGSGHPAEAVTWKKQQTIRKCAQNFLYRIRMRKGAWIPGKHIRFDVIAILGTQSIEHYKNAF